MAGLSIFISLTLLGSLPVRQAFNVDLSRPLEYRASDAGLASERSAYFGFSVDQHVGRDRRTKQILVGAPRANTSQPGVTEGGACYVCDATPGGTCRAQIFDTQGNQQLNLGSGLETIEEKSYQWMGATIASARLASPGDILACSPHYKYFSMNVDKRAPIGTCFYHDASDFLNRRLNPVKQTVDDITNRIPSSTEQYSFEGKAMYGMSGIISQDGTTVFAGAPGSFNWKGRLYMTNTQSFETEGSATSRSNILETSSYMGYAVAHGRLFSRTALDFIAGIPRGGEFVTGMIQIFDKDFIPSHIKHGEQQGEYYGHSLAVGDFNADGHDDVAVGAPFYAKKGSHHDTGRVHLHYTLGLNFRKREYIEGQSRPGERFGFSLAVTGDINSDGFTDLAVGSPYGGREGRGCVYIFHGSSSGLKSIPSQIIDSADLGAQHRGFGFSLAAGLDMDNNQYPDITVGAYLSQSVVQLWSRPVLRFYVNMTSPPSIGLERKAGTLPDGTRVTIFTVGLVYSHDLQRRGVVLGLNLLVRLDAYHDLAPRAFFRIPSGKSSTYQQQINMVSDVKRGIVTLPEIYIQPNIRDKLAPITVNLDYNVTVTALAGGLTEVMDAEITRNSRADVFIEKDCGQDKVCIPDLRVRAKELTKKFIIGSPKGSIDIRINVKNQASDGAYEAQLTISLPPTITYVNLKDVHSAVPVKCTPHEATDKRAFSRGNVVCDIGNPLPGNAEVNLTVIVDAKNIDGSSDFLDFMVSVNSSNQEDPSTMIDNVDDVLVGVTAVTNIRLTGVSEPEQLLFHENETAGRREGVHLYDLQNFGPSNIKNATLHVLWPSRTLDGDELLPLKGTPTVVGQVGRCSVLRVPSKPKVNDGSKESSAAQLRRRRDIPEDQGGQETFYRKLSCAELYVACTIIMCQLGPIESAQQVQVKVEWEIGEDFRTRLQSSTILMSSMGTARVESVPYLAVQLEGQPSESFMVETTLATLGPGKATAAAIWVIGVSVAGGIVLLIILVIIMHRCGFFKRNKPQQEEGDAWESGLVGPGDEGEDEPDGQPLAKRAASAESLEREGNRNSRIDTINMKLILRNGISLSIEEKR